LPPANPPPRLPAPARSDKYLPDCLHREEVLPVRGYVPPVLRDLRLPPPAAAAAAARLVAGGGDPAGPAVYIRVSGPAAGEKVRELFREGGHDTRWEQPGSVLSSAAPTGRDDVRALLASLRENREVLGILDLWEVAPGKDRAPPAPGPERTAAAGAGSQDSGTPLLDRVRRVDTAAPAPATDAPAPPAPAPEAEAAAPEAEAEAEAEAEDDGFEQLPAEKWTPEGVRKTMHLLRELLASTAGSAVDIRSSATPSKSHDGAGPSVQVGGAGEGPEGDGAGCRHAACELSPKCLVRVLEDLKTTYAPRAGGGVNGADVFRNRAADTLLLRLKEREQWKAGTGRLPSDDEGWGRQQGNYAVTPENIHMLRRGHVGGSNIAKLLEVLTTGRLRKLDHRAGDPEERRARALLGIWGFADRTARAGANREIAAGVYDNTFPVDKSLMPAHLTEQQRTGLRYRYEVEARRRENQWVGALPRAKVAQVERIVKRELRGLLGPDLARRTCVGAMGSYRRGKLFLGDVDVLVCPDVDDVELQDLAGRLVKRLLAVGLLTHDNHAGEKAEELVQTAARRRAEPRPGPRESRAVSKQALGEMGPFERQAKESWSYMLLGIFRVPRDDGTLDLSAEPSSRPLREGEAPRFGRIDFKFFPKRGQGPALLYFTGSHDFNIALKHWSRRRCQDVAKQLCPHADAMRLGCDRLYPINTRVATTGRGGRWDDAPAVGGPLPGLETEKAVFDALRLDYVPPHLRDLRMGTYKKADQ